MSRLSSPVSRRGLIGVGSAGLGGLLLSGCDRLTYAPSIQHFIGKAQGLSMGAQRLLLSGQPLAREYTAKDLSPDFKANGSTMPDDEAYQTLMDGGFADYRLKVDGLVHAPAQFSLADLKAMPSRTQITRHDCVEGWSCIGKWTGAPLADLIREAGLKPDAKYLVFHCMDTLGGSADSPDHEASRYYESIALADVVHPQSLLAYEMNGQPLGVPHGAPLRLRVERHLGYKQAKYIERIEAVASLDKLHGGKGGYWPDRGYEWYAGI